MLAQPLVAHQSASAGRSRSQQQQQQQQHNHRHRCMFSKPMLLIAFILVTVVWLWLTAHPLFSSFSPRTPMHAHALSISLDPNSYAGVLVDASDDAAAVSRWRAQLHHLHHQEALPAEADDPSATRTAQPPFTCYGVHAQQGRRDYMEDTHAVYLRHTLHYSTGGGGGKTEHLSSRDVEEGEADVLSPWALFGVFDGHGGPEASEYAAAYLLPSLHSALLHQGFTGGGSSSGPGASESADRAVGAAAPVALSAPPTALNVSATFSTAFQKLDHEFRELVARPRGLQDGSTALVAGLYHRKDAAEGEPPFQLVVGNLGDCRAVLIQPSREDVPVHNVDEEAALLPAPSAAPAPSNVLALSTDHKPDLPAERAYVESLPGGFVTRARPGRSLARVQGVLAVSRAIGDASLKPWVRSEPDVRIIELEDSDAPAFAAAQCAPEEHRSVPSCSASNSISSVGVTTPLLLLASDGFWDVFDNTEAGQFALDFLHERAMQQMSSASSSSSSSSPSDTSTAAGDNPPAAAPTAVPVLSALAQHLVTEAYLRGSFDNISVMTIDVACIQRWLKQQQQRSQSVATPQAAPI